MTLKKETIEQFNQQLDDLLQNKTHYPNSRDQNAPLLRLADTLRQTDFSHESDARPRLRQRLMNELNSQQTAHNRPQAWQRLSITWLVAVFTVIVAVTIFTSIQSNDSPSYSSLIQQPDSTLTIAPILLTITPMVSNANATLLAMPSITPTSISIVNIMPLEDVITTFYVSRMSLSKFRLVVIASQDIPANTVLEADMLTEALIPIEIAPPTGYSSVELLVGLTVEDAIPQWAPVSSVRLYIDDPNYVAITLPDNVPIFDELKTLEEGEGFGITGTFRFVDVDESFQSPAFETILPPASAFDGDVQSISEEIVTDAVIVWNSYRQDFNGCLSRFNTIDAGIGEEIPINAPSRYPCFLIVTMPPQNADVFTWALEAQIPMTITVADFE